MARDLLLYISASTDLEPEREILGRAVAEIPLDLGWRIVQSSSQDVPVEREAVIGADVHLLLLGSDIRAPVGLEWQIARRADRWPAAFLKEGALRTPAAQSFVRFVQSQLAWQAFKDAADLRRQVLRLLVRYLLDRAAVFGLSPLELASLRDWRADLETSAPMTDGNTGGGAGQSGILLSREHHLPSEGVLITTDRDLGAR